MRRRMCVGALLLMMAVRSPGQVVDRAETIRRQVAGILRGPEYVAAERKEAFLERIGNWARDALTRLAEQIERLFRFGMEQNGVHGRVLTWFIILAVLAGVIYAAVKGVRLLGRARSSRTRPRKRVLPKVAGPPDQASAADLYAQAVACAGRREWGRAYELVVAALLHRLDESGIVTLDPARTNGEYLRRLADHERLRRLLGPLLWRYDGAKYGGRAPGPEDLRICLRAWEHGAWREAAQRDQAGAHGP